MWVRPGQRAQPGQREQLVQPALKVQLERPALKATPERLALKAQLGRMEAMVLMVQTAQQAQREVMEPMARRC